MEEKVGVIGLGVGYALACCLAEAGYGTVGIDANPEVVAKPRIDPSVKGLLEYDSRHRKNIAMHLQLSTDYGALSRAIMLQFVSVQVTRRSWFSVTLKMPLVHIAGWRSMVPP